MTVDTSFAWKGKGRACGWLVNDDSPTPVGLPDPWHRHPRHISRAEPHYANHLISMISLDLDYSTCAIIINRLPMRSLLLLLVSCASQPVAQFCTPSPVSPPGSRRTSNLYPTAKTCRQSPHTLKSNRKVVFCNDIDIVHDKASQNILGKIERYVICPIRL